MQFITIFLCLVFGAFAQAESGSYLPHYKVKKEVRAKWQKQQDATFPIKFEAGLNCTAVFVGPDGQALTNLHCLEDCLTDAGAVKQTGPLMEVSFTAPVKCGALYTKKRVPVEAKVLHVFGPGWIKNRDQINQVFAQRPDLLFKLMDTGFESFGDLVLIQLPVKSSCVPIDTPQEKESVVNISYPLLNRPTENPMEHLLALGTTQMWSFGEIVSDTEKITEILERDPVLKDYVSSIAIHGLTLSSIDSEPGASGSPVFNQAGAVIAIQRATVKGLRYDYVPWTTQGIQLGRLKEKIEALIPNVKNCL